MLEFIYFLKQIVHSQVRFFLMCYVLQCLSRRSLPNTLGPSHSVLILGGHQYYQFLSLPETFHASPSRQTFVLCILFHSLLYLQQHITQSILHSFIAFTISCKDIIQIEISLFLSLFFFFGCFSVFHCRNIQIFLTQSTFEAAAAAKLLQSCLTLCDPRDGSPPGSPVPGILQARILEWVAVFFSNA